MFGQQASHELTKLHGHATHQLIDTRRHLVKVLPRESVGILPLEGTSTSDETVQQYPQCIQVGATVHVGTTQLLWRCVGIGPDKLPNLCRVMAISRVSGSPKVDQAGPTSRMHQNIRALHVPMHDPPRVDVVQTLAEGQSHPHRRRGPPTGARPTTRPNIGLGRAPLDERHGEPGPTVLRTAKPDHRHHARVIQHAENTELVGEALFGCTPCDQELEGKAATLVGCLHLVDPGEPTATDVSHHPVGTHGRGMGRRPHIVILAAGRDRIVAGGLIVPLAAADARE